MAGLCFFANISNPGYTSEDSSGDINRHCYHSLLAQLVVFPAVKADVNNFSSDATLDQGSLSPGMQISPECHMPQFEPKVAEEVQNTVKIPKGSTNTTYYKV